MFVSYSKVQFARPLIIVERPRSSFRFHANKNICRDDQFVVCILIFELVQSMDEKKMCDDPCVDLISVTFNVIIGL